MCKPRLSPRKGRGKEGVRVEDNRDTPSRVQQNAREKRERVKNMTLISVTVINFFFLCEYMLWLSSRIMFDT